MSRLLSFLRTPKGRYLLVGLAAMLVSWFLLRGCSDGHRFIHPRYHVAVDKSWYPLALYGKELNFVAFTDELLDAIADESPLRFTLVEVGTPNLIQDLDSGIYEAIVSAMPPTHLNMIKYRFSDPLYLLGPVVIVKIDSPIKSFEELAGHFVGIKRGTALNFDVPFPNANVAPYDNMTLAIADLEDNKIDALIMDSLQAFVQIQGIYAGHVKIVTMPLTQDGLRLVTLNSPHYDDFFETFNQTLKKLKESGKYEEIITHWGLYNPAIVGVRPE